ncbi:MAG: YraN family protein, partial [Deltaproteobacteria bacterium]
MPDPRRNRGDRGEEAAARYLQRLGYKIVARNYSCRYGEVDLIALDGRTLVFIEVKLRRGRFDPLEAVDERKQRHLSRVAFDFLRRHAMLGRPARFDVVAVDGRTMECRHVV